MQQASKHQPILQLKNIETVYHGVVRVLQGLSLEVPKGSIVALLGPNGAGKTTALRAVTGLLPIHEGTITKGEVYFDGHKIENASPPALVRAGLAQIMEGRRIFPELTVEENLWSGGWSVARHQIVERIAQAFERFPILQQRRNQFAGYLSGGEQQMLAISRALI